MNFSAGVGPLPEAVATWALLMVAERWWRPAVLFALVATGALARTSTDLDVGWISRLPEIDYVRQSANPRVEGWPADGEPVTWRAHVRNWSTQSQRVTFEWLLDRTVIASGSVELPADAMSTVDLVRPWMFDRHELSFRIDSDSDLVEESKSNNELTVFTDAIAVGFWVEESFYRFMRENQQKLSGIGSASFEDWAQRHIDWYNQMAPLAIYPETPNGVRDRWRLQKVVVVPDGTLPLVPVDPSVGNASSHPDDSDRTVDLSWGFTSELIPIFNDLTSVSPFNIFYLGKSLIHELGHARYLIDVYGLAVKHLPPLYRVEIEEKGVSVVGNLMPASGLIFNGVPGYTVFETQDGGLMAYDYDWIDRHSAAALNLIAGSRAVAGTANVPENYAVYLNDLPAENRVTLRDRNGAPIANADVDVFQGVSATEDPANLEAYLSRVVDDTPDLHFRSDALGRILVGRNPFAWHDLSGNREGELTAILRARGNGKTSFGFLESRVFNLAYWRGERDLADHEVFFGVRCSEVRPNLAAPAYLAKLDTNQVTLRWQTTTGAKSYTVWASTDGAAPVAIADHITGTSVTASFHGTVRWWVENHVELACPSRRSLTYTFITLPAAPRRRSARH